MRGDPRQSGWVGPGQAQADAAAAGELYLDALEKLDAGRREGGLELLQQLLDRYPQTAVASLARRVIESHRVPETEAPAPPPASAGALAIKADPKDDELQRRLLTTVGDRVFFPASSAALGARARIAIEGQAAWLKKQTFSQLTIEGHADDPGSDQDNLDLSQLRAETVRLQFVAAGIEPSRISAIASGRAKRVAVCAEPGCQEQNRRVVTSIRRPAANGSAGPRIQRPWRRSSRSSLLELARHVDKGGRSVEPWAKAT